MTIKLTPKQEKFAQGVASGLSQSDAYRKSFNVRKNTKPESVNQAASKLMSNTNISSRVRELQKPYIEEAGITLQSHLAALKSLHDLAISTEDWSPAITAEIARGKVAGLYVEKVEHTGNVTVEVIDYAKQHKSK